MEHLFLLSLSFFLCVSAPLWLFPSQIIVAAITPINTAGAEDINADEIFSSYGFVRHVRRDLNHLARAERQFFGADFEAHRAGYAITELLAFMVMQRHHAALLYV